VKKDERVFLEHILECIGLVEEYTRGKALDDFLASRQLQDAVISKMRYRR